MFPTTCFESCLERLRGHFHSVAVGPPATVEQLADLRRVFRSVPPVVERFYSFCSGIKVAVEDTCKGEVMTLGVSLSDLPLPDFFDDPEQYLPITWDGCGNNDCLVLRPGFGEGAVVFLDHASGEGPAYLVAGSIQGFLTMWTDSLVYRYDAQGELNPKCRPIELDQWPFLQPSPEDHPWPFDLEWMQANDPSAAQLISDERFSEWILEGD
jgi:hypothetical protein